MLGRVTYPGLFFQHDTTTGNYQDLEFGKGWQGPSLNYRKIEKLEKYFNGITRIEMILSNSGDLSEAELVISVKRGSQIVCRTQDKDLYAAIDLVLDKAEAQLTKHKERLKEHRGQ